MNLEENAAVENAPDQAPVFDEPFRRALRDLLVWRRDVRSFRSDPVEPALVAELIEAACLSPSVGYSQPWRFVSVETPLLREAVIDNFAACNQAALADYEGEQARLYASLKLAGLKAAPVHLAVFADAATRRGSGLGRKTMPETLEYSVVTAIHTLWLVARAHGLGTGWISILEPGRVREILQAPEQWALVAYLCLGYPEQERSRPELLAAGWESKDSASRVLYRR